MDFDTVHAFVAVARAGGFAAASRRLRVPRSTLSRQLQRLEESLGVRLLERTTRAVRLTDAGQTYFHRCSHALELIESANRGAQEAGAQPKGRLHVSAPIDIARYVVSGMLSEFRRRYPDVELSVEVTQRRVDLVAEGFDLALRGGDRGGDHLHDSSMVARKLCSHVFHLFASPGYLAARGNPRSPAELAKHDLIAFGAGAEAIPWRLAGPEGAITVVPIPWLIANEFGLQLEAMIAGLGIGVSEPIGVTRSVREGTLVCVMPEYSMHGGTLYAVYPSARRVAPKVRAFIAVLEEHLQAFGWGTR
jgi:DNA-binding transcriptional LysR family regulator